MADVRAGQAYVELAVKDDKLTAGLRKAEASLKAFGNSVGALGTKFAALGAVMVTPLFAAAKQFADSGTALLLMSERTGIAVESLSALTYAANQAGVETEELEVGLRHLSKTTPSGAPLDKQLEQIADALSKLPAGAARGAAAMDLFGRSGTALLPLLNKGAEGIRNLREEAERLGLVKSKEQAEDARALSLALGAASRAAQSLYTTLGGLIAPVLTGIAKAVLPIVASVRAWIKEHKPLWNALLITGLAISAIGAALLGVAGIIKLVSMALAPIVGTISLIFSIIGGLVSFVFSPLGALVTVLGTLGAVFLYVTGLGAKMLAALGTAFGQIGEIATAAFAGITAAIQDNDWETVFKIAWTAIQGVFWSAIAALKSIWRDFSGWFVDQWHGAVHVVSEGIQGLIGSEEASLELERAHTAEVRERHRERAAAAAADQARVEALNAEVRALSEAAEAAHRRREMTRLGEGAIGGLDMAARNIDVRGTFSAAAVGGLGATSVIESLLTQIRDNTDPRRNPSAVFG
jgi:hypothetical protein